MIKGIIDVVAKTRQSLTYESPIGPIALHSEGDFLVSVELGKRTKTSGSSSVLKQTVKELDSYFSGKLAKFSIKTKVTGTAFQKSVWREIAKLGFSESKSYGEIAKAIGSPKASRAVGAAVGSNPIPLVVGCHRVLGSTGKITGFTGAKGIKTKAWLLKHENLAFKL